MTPFQEAVEAVETLSEIFNSSLYDAELQRWRKVVEPVYVKADSSRWCARHWSVILNLDDAHCSAFGMGDEDPDERCVPVPLYVEAPDP